MGIRMRRWEGNIKINLKYNTCESVDWVHVTQDSNQWRVSLNAVETLGLHKS
jgi:hypothetical protein